MLAVQEQEQWRFSSWDPPDDRRAIELGEFLRDQSADPAQVPAEKISYLRWKLTQNYVHPGFASAMVTGRTGRCVSLCTVTPKRLWLEGREVAWAEIGDTFTDERYQRKGMFTKLVNASRERAQRAGFAIVYGLPNDQSRPGYLAKLDFAVKPDLGLFRHSLPLSTRALSTRRLMDRYPALRLALGHPLTRRLSAALAGAALWPLTLSPGIVVGEEPCFTAEFDGLWQRARRRLPAAQVRDARHLAWRYDRNPFSFTVLAARRGGVLCGYLITTYLDGPASRGFRHAMIVDWLYEDVAGVARALLGGAIRHAVTSAADLISGVMTPLTPLPLPFTTSLFLREAVDLPVILHRNEPGLALLGARRPFHFTLSDTDTV